MSSVRAGIGCVGKVVALDVQCHRGNCGFVVAGLGGGARTSTSQQFIA